MSIKWVPVRNYENRYLVSDTGRVYSIITKRDLKPFVSKDDKGNSKRLNVVLNINNKHVEKAIKRLVYEAFIGNLTREDVVINIDGDIYNNSISNLKKVSRKYINAKYHSTPDKDHYIRYLNGYKVIYRPDHFHHNLGIDYEGWVYEHRYVIECALGRALTHDECVHHIDGDKLNNDISNLQVLTRSNHCKLHMIKKYGPKELSYCIDCGKEITSGSIRCLSCHRKYIHKHIPDKYKLYEELKNSNYTKLAKKYGVSTTTIECWLEDLYKPKHRKKVN